MLSRVAENIYWMSCHIERAENTARLVSVATNLMLDLPTGMRQVWGPLIAISGGDDIYRKSHDDYGERAVLRCASQARSRCAEGVSGRLSPTRWREVGVGVPFPAPPGVGTRERGTPWRWVDSEEGEFRRLGLVGTIRVGAVLGSSPASRSPLDQAPTFQIADRVAETLVLHA